MLKVMIILGWVAASLAGAATRLEDFGADPLSRGWRVFGDTDLFSWDAANQDMQVTWDSSRTNSYLQLPLGTILTREDDFAFALDLRIDDVVGGVNPLKPFTFEIAFGLQNAVDAQRTNFFRGLFGSARNLAEFNYFPAADQVQASVTTALWSTNARLNYSGSGDNTILELPVGVWMRISVAYSASSRVVGATITTNGEAFAAINPVPLSPSFTDFRVDTFAVESYSDAGQSGSPTGSILAHGVVDNIEILVPPGPVRNLRLVYVNQVCRASFLSLTNWVYSLERSSDFISWISLPGTVTGDGGAVTIPDADPPAGGAFYRVRSWRP
jgi:hypothetical protein